MGNVLNDVVRVMGMDVEEFLCIEKELSYVTALIIIIILENFDKMFNLIEKALELNRKVPKFSQDALFEIKVSL